LRYDHRAKRGAGNVLGESAFVPKGTSSEVQGIAEVEDGIGRHSEPTPEQVAVFGEECERLLERFPSAKIRETAELLLQGYHKKDIAERMDCSVRSVERRIAEIADILSNVKEDES
jgi:DNA-directed RNA polymerase specialized sigma24 family protein